ncbi:translocation/assembly module TamB domain-containing protein [Aurantimonas sp. VKM B-3413]|uniref:translocation/assembly module TamB domain-containing protein n=1 Tax=Aurantimonas sp. VKM B-3413 TaxID=2779401 RepID=UPI001E56BCE0|nr:translocation/assembly module TamB domain-containing protein [Aurantimonas sp. VKM B-3413]MCB8839641.1 translocation/assembly module TamB domain-containing protein [Aurantimonas sp. VKM B-3413]
MTSVRSLAALLLAVIAGSFLSLAPVHPAAAQGFVASQLESFLSTDTMTVKIDGLSGALSGNVRIEKVTVSDPQGVFLTASNLAMDWSPLSLVRSNVNIDNLTAGQIVLDRLPVGQPQSSGGGSSLPSLTANIDNLSIDEFILGEAIAGTRARLSAKASLKLAADPTALSLNANINRLDQPGQIALDLAYAPDENQLKVDIKASEPRGGLVATLLNIPDRPAIDLTVNGSGPLSNFMANGALTVGGEQAASLTARVDAVDSGRRVSASLSVAAARFAPAEYQRYLAGGANLDAQILVAGDGTYRIEQGSLTSDAVSVTASGTLDPNGSANDFSVKLTSRDGSPIRYEFGAAPNAGSVSLENLQASLAGAFANAELTATASVPSARFGDYAAQSLDASVKSTGFDINAATGPFTLQATAASASAPDGVVANILSGPVKITLDGALTGSGLTIVSSKVATDTASASAEGSAALDFSTFDLGLNAQTRTAALADALAPTAGDSIELSGQVARAQDGTISAQSLSVTAPNLTLSGNAALAPDQTVSANISGTLKDASRASPSLAGAASFTLAANGPVAKPNVELTVNGDGLAVNGQQLSGLTVNAKGTLDPEALSASLNASGSLNGQPLQASAQLSSLDDGRYRVSDLVLRQGPNAITGALTLTPSFLPTGNLDVAVEDLESLAALGGVEAAGDLNGSVDLTVSDGGQPNAAVTLTGNRLSVSGNTLTGVKVDVAVADYLGTTTPTGTITASAIDASSLAVRDLQIALTDAAPGIGITVDAAVNDVPVALAGTVTFPGQATEITLSRLSADIPDAAITLPDPATIRLANGTTTLSGLTLSVGGGSVQLSGGAGETLDLALDLTSVPAAVANPFVPDLAAAGTLSGTARVTGTPASPDATFDITADSVAVAQSRSANVPPIDGTVSGSYRNDALTLDTARLDLGSGSLTASGSVGETYDLTANLNDVPMALANGFVSGLDASGTISGKATVTGPRADPAATFNVEGREITATKIAKAGIEPLSLDVAGSYANETVTLSQANIAVGDGSLTASGTIGKTLDVDVSANALPVGLANGFVEGLQASGTISGTASASGMLTEPTAQFDLSGQNITTRQIAQSGTAPLNLRLAGSYEKGTANLETAVVDVGDGSLTATGQIGQTLDVSVKANQIPVGLANGFVDGLGASGTISGTAKASGPISNPNATFDLSGSGITAVGIEKSGIEPLDLTASGSVADQTLTLQSAKVTVGDGSLTANGTVGQNLDLTLSLDQLPVGLVNGYLPNLGATGTISGNAKATGSLSDPEATFSVDGSGITTKQIAQSGIAPLSLDVAGSYADRIATIEEANLKVGDGRLTTSGTIGQSLDLTATLRDLPVGLVNGYLPDLGATGTISGDAKATGSLSDPQATFSLTGTGITTKEIAQSGVAPLSLDAAGSYQNGTATIRNAEVTVGDGSLSASGTVGQTLDLDLSLKDLPVGIANGFVPDLDARGTISGSGRATGSLSDPQADFTLTGTGITTRQIAQSGVAPLSVDIAGSYQNGTATIANGEVVVGNGSLQASGTVGQSLDLAVTLKQLPIGLANGFVDGLGAQGTLSGTASAKGSLSSPDASFDITASNVSVAQGRAAGAPPVDAKASGRYQNGTLTLANADVRVGGGSIAVTGTAGASALDLTARIDGLPASIAGSAAGGLAPQGTINGTLRATGAPTNPSVTYDIQANGVSIQQTRDAGVGALAITTSGQYANRRVTTDTRVTGAGGIDLSASGSVSLAGTPSLDLAVNGTAPLSVANPILAAGGRSIQGTVRLDARVTGPLSQPNVNGTISTAGAQLVDTNFNIALNDITTTIALSGQTATIQDFTAQLSSGGTLSVGGTVALTGQFPADLSIRLVNGRYNDGELIAARLGADLKLTGPLLGTPLLSGTINAEEIDIIVPENLPSSLARIDVTHRNARPAVLKQQREINPNRGQGASAGGGINLDLTFNAPNRVFVRGRGLDIVLGGSIDITGSAANPNIVGGFDLQRGRFQILARRLDFTRGRLTFTGGLVPTLDLLAESTVDNTTVYIAVTGPATDPSFTFSSNPALPQDEVLARLIFGQGTSDLSPLQIAQLAEAAATLAGVGGSTGLLDNLRSQLGVDDLDIKTTSDGQTAVGVGKYLNDNTYLGVDSTGRVSLDLKLGGGLKARGAVTSSGGGEVGVFYEGEF